MTDPISLLRDADPAARAPEADRPPPRELLERIVAAPPPPRRRRMPRRLALVAVAAAVALAVAVAIVPGDRGDLLARAYAVTSPGDGVLYTELYSEQEMPGFGGERSVTRIWQRGDRSHRIRRLVDARGRTRTYPGHDRPWVYEYVQDDGVLRALLPEGEIQTVRERHGGEARTILERERTSFVDSFRARYAGADLADAGETTFDGHPARAYDVRRANQWHETYYVDPESGTPMGFVVTFPMERPGGRVTEARYTEVLRRLERLPATPENLARLTAPWVKRAERPGPPGS
jgi:hypothetical protein